MRPSVEPGGELAGEVDDGGPMRIMLRLAYRGSAYHGWQIQPDRPTVQGRVEEAVAEVAGEEVSVTGASRTDAGVHAAGQVCHFDPPRRRPPGVWKRALNALLPGAIRVLVAAEVDDGFHARYDAVRKVYRYHVDPSPVASPFLAAVAWHRPGRLDLVRMRTAAELIASASDQRAFATRPEDGPPRPVRSCTVHRDRLLTVTVVGRSFLRRAVRGMAGTVVDVGGGRLELEEVRQAIRTGERRRAGRAAPPHGLVLVRVDYPDRSGG